MNSALRKFIDLHPELSSASPEEITSRLLDEIQKLKDGGEKH